MLKSLEDISATKKRLHIEIPADAFESEISSSLNRLRSRTKLPGFRQGKAPLALIEKRYGKDVESEAVEKVVPQYYGLALKEADITPVVQPVLEGALEFKRNEPMSLTFVVEVAPRVENLSYEGVRVKDVALEVKDSDVDVTLERLRRDKAVYEPSGDPVSDDDLVVMDYEVVEDEKRFEDEVFTVGSDLMPGEFSENLKGLKKGEQKEFQVSFAGDYQAEELAGRTVTFKVTVKDVKKVDLPDIDDEFAKDLGFDDLASLKKNVSERLEKSRDDTRNRILKAEVMKKVLEQNQFEAPESLVEGELGFAVQQAKARGRKDSDEVLKEELRPAAERQIRASLLLQMIADKEGLGVSDDDIRGRLEELSRQLNLSPENVVKYYVSRDGSLDGLRQSMLEDKVLDLLLERAVVEEAPPEEAEKAAAEAAQQKPKGE